MSSSTRRTPLPFTAHTHMAKILGLALPAGLTTAEDMNVGRDGAEHRAWVEQIAYHAQTLKGSERGHELDAIMIEVELFRAANLREDARLRL